MKTATKILSEEHEHILKVISVLEKECSALESGKKKLNIGFFEKTIDFIRNYADKYHHAKEEDILFKELNKDSCEMHCNPTGQMLHEHDQGRKFVKGLVSALEKKNTKKIIENVEGYCHLLTEHIYKEDNILYKMADDALNAKVQKSMLEKFDKVEKSYKKTKEHCLKIEKELTKK